MRERWRVLFWAMLVAAALGLTAAPAVAQSTGGSFGGGSFGGGGGGGSYGGGGGSFGGGSYGGSSYGGGGTYYSSGGGGGGSLGGVCFSVVIMLVIFGIRMYIQSNRGNRGTTPSHGARAWNNVDVSAIRLGIDWRARKDLQAQLARLASSGNTSSQQGLAMLLRETILALRRAELSWLYASIANYHPMSAPSAEGIFRQTTGDARARFKEELVRNADGSTSTRDASARRAHAHEGEGVVVVTLVVASRREIVDVTEAADASRIKTLLDDMLASANPHSLVAMEVVWSPAQEEDRMSTAELEQNYPDLKKIDERSIAGRVFCGYCRGPFAMELLKCPHCGAPAPGTERRA